MAKIIKQALIAAAVVFITIYTAGAINPALLTTMGAAAGTTAFAFAKAMAILTFVGTSVAGGIAMLTSRGIEATRQNFGTKVAGRGAQVARQIVYGKARVGGTIVKMHVSGTDNSKLHLAIVLAGHEIESLEGVYFGETLLTTSSQTITHPDGGAAENYFKVTNSDFKNNTNDNAIDTGGTLVQYSFMDGSQTRRNGLAATNSSRFPATAKFQGLAYVYMEVVYDPEKLGGLPAMHFLIKGKKVYDPRTSSTAWSDNPALHVRDFLMDTTYGLKATSSEINDTTTAGGFQAAANACEVSVDLNSDGSQTEERFTSNGFVNAAAAPDGVIEGILSACAGKLTYTNGKFNIFVGTAQTPSLTIVDEDILEAQQVATKQGNGELYNGIKALFVDSTQLYTGAETPVYVNSTHLLDDTPNRQSSDTANYKKILETQLPFTVTHTMAQRLQKIQYFRQRESSSLSLLTSLEYMQLQPGDWVNVTNSRLSYSSKTFEVVSTSMEFAENEGQIYAATRLALQEVSAATYNYIYSEYSTPQTAGSNIPTGDLSIAAPTAGTLSNRTRSEGPTAKIDIIVPWTNATDLAIQGTEVQYRENGASDYDVATIAVRGSTSAVISGVQVGKTYNVRIRHFSFDNVYSSYATYSDITIPEPDTIAAPTSLAATTDKPFFIELTWTNPTNGNYRAVEVHFSTTDGFTPDATTLLNSYYGEVGKQKKVILGVSAGLSYDTNYYFKARAVNVYGTASAYTSQVTGKFVQAAAGDLAANSVTASQINVANLSSVSSDLGSITAGSININSGQFTVSSTGAMVAQSATITGSVTSSSGTIGGFTLAADKLSAGADATAVSLSTADGIHLGATAFGSAPFSVTRAGAVSATSGTIGGFTLASNKLSAGTGATTVSMSTADGIHLGATAFADAPFSVTPAGVIKSTSGTIGGFTLASNKLSAGADATTVSMSTADGIHLGATAFASAPFRVTRAGALTATDATITGAVTATSGTFTGTVNASAGAFTGDVTTNSKFTAGSSDDVAVVDGGDVLYRFYAGDASAENAAFRVDKDGHIDARDIRIYDENGQVILDATGLHGSGLGDISANAGVGVAEVAGRLDNNTDEITFTTGTASEAYTFETKVQIEINQNGESGETPTTSNLSFAGADQSAVTTIIGQVKLIVEYFVKVSGGSYSATPTATDEFTFVSGTSASASQLGVNVLTLGSRGAGLIYANLGASEAIADPSISGARTFVKSTKDITFSTAETHVIKVNARIATTAGTTLTTSTTPALDASVTTGTGVILGSDETQSSLEDFRRLYTIRPASGNTKTIIASTTDDTFSSTGGSSLLTSGGTISGSLVITQDLTVQGTTTTLDTTNTLIKDALIELNSGLTGANANDTGLILERGSTGNNVFIGWDESSDRVTFATTTATGASTGNLSLTATDIQAAALRGSSVVTGGTERIDNSGNLSNIGTISSGAISSTGRSTFDSVTIDDDGSSSPILRVVADDLNPWAFQIENSSATNSGLFQAYVNDNNNLYFRAKETGAYPTWYLQVSNGTTVVDALYLNSSGINAAGYINGATYRVGGTEVIDSSRNLASIGTISSGAIAANSGTTNTVATFTSTDTGAGVQLTDSTGSSKLETSGANLRVSVDDDGAVANSAIQFRVDGGTKATLNSSGNLDVTGTISSGAITSSGNIVNDIGNSGDDSYIELKNTGYTGNITSLRQNADSTRSELNSTERPIYIQAGSGGGATGAEVRLYANQQLGFKLDANKAATFYGQAEFPSANTSRPVLTGGFLGRQTGDGDVDIWGISETYYPSAGTTTNAWGIRWASSPNEIQFVGGNSNRVTFDLDNGNTVIGGTLSSGAQTITHTNFSSDPYSGLQITNTSTSGTAYTGVTSDAVFQSHYRYKLNGALKWQTRVGAGNGTDDFRVYSWTASADILTIKNNKRVGINQLNPSGALQVDWSNNAASGNVYFRNTSSGSSAYGGIYLGNNTTATQGFIGVLSSNNGAYAGASSMLLGTNSAAGIGFMTSGGLKAEISSGGTLHLNNYTASNAKLRAQQTTNSEWVANFINYTAAAYGVSIDTSSATTSSTYNFAAYTPSGTGFFINNYGVASLGTTMYDSTNTGLQLMGRGIAIKNDRDGSNNNWSRIQNRAAGSASDLYFGLGSGNIRFDHGGAIITNVVAGYHNYINAGQADSDFIVRTTGNTNMLHVDGGGNRVGVGTSTTSEVLTVSGVIAASASSYTVNATTANFGYYNGSGTPTTYVQMPANGRFQLWKPNTGAYFKADSGGRIGIQKDPVSTVSLSIAAQATSNSSYGLEVTNATSNTRFLVDGTGHSYFYKTDNAVGMRWDAVNSRLGVNVGSPSYTLDVRGNARIGNGISAEQDIIFQAGSGNWQVGTNASGNGTSNNQFYIYDSAYRFTVQKGANRVGIGTNAPVGTLELNNGSSAVELQFKETSTAYHRLGIKKLGSQLQFGEYNNDGTSLTSILTLDGNGDNATLATSRTSGANATVLTLSDNVTGVQTSGFGTQIRGVSNGGSAISAIGFEAYGGTNNDTAIAFYTQSVAGGLARRMTISDDGNIGVGTATPRAATGYTNLSLNGSVSGLIDINTNGTRVLSIYGSGNHAEFVNPTSSGQMRFYTNNLERIKIDPSGHIVVNDSSYNADFRIESDGNENMFRLDGGSNTVNIGSAVGKQTIAHLNVRKNGGAIEFGHGNNTSGYYGTLGSYGNNGMPYIGFSTYSETNLNTFTTNGFAGNIIVSDQGTLQFNQVTNTNATGQTPVRRMTLTTSGRLMLHNETGPTSHAALNIGYVGGETRAIDIHGAWSSTESKSISFTHGSSTSNLVGQMRMTYNIGNGVNNNSTGSVLQIGRFYHGGDSTAFPVNIYSQSTVEATVHIQALPTGTTAANDAFQVSTTGYGAIHAIGNQNGTNGSADTIGMITIGGNTGVTVQGGIYASQSSGSGTAISIFTTDSYASGPKQSLTVESAGHVVVNRGNLEMAGTTVIFSNTSMRTFQDFDMYSTGSNTTAYAHADARDDTVGGARIHRFNRSPSVGYRPYYENWYDGSSYLSIGVDSGVWKLSDGLDVSGASHITTSGGSTTAPNVVLTVQANTSSTITTGGGTAIKFKGVSSGGNIQNYDQAMIASLGQATNNGHGLDFYIKPHGSAALTKAVTITSGKVLNAVGGYQQNGTTVIDSSSGHLASDGSASVPSYRFSSDTDTGFYRSGSGDVSLSSNGTQAMELKAYGVDMTMNSNGYVDLNRSGFITFYGNASGYHGIGSRDHTGSATDDLRINSFAQLAINLDSNNNNSSAADLMIGRHGGATGNMDLLVNISGEDGSIVTEGNVTAYGSLSDIRIKTSIETIENAVSKVGSLRGITFEYKKDGTRSTGLIAQDVQKVLPEAVYTTTELDSEDPILAIRYANTVGLLVEAIKEQQQTIDALIERITKLEKKNGSDKNEQD